MTGSIHETYQVNHGKHVINVTNVRPNLPQEDAALLKKAVENDLYSIFSKYSSKHTAHTA